MDTYKEIGKLLSSNEYPGRGIILGTSPDGTKAVAAYFIMGRSENSRNRIFVPDGEGLKTKAYDEAKLTDSSLIIYSPVRVYKNDTIVTNGDQTDTIYSYLEKGLTFERALQIRSFEPDSPNFTPRISGIINKNGYTLSILKSVMGMGDYVQRFFYEYPKPVDGMGHFIHTYKCNGNPIPSFEGEPKPVKIEGGIDEFTQNIWNSLNADNKVSLFTRFISLEDGSEETRVVNKLGEDA